MHGSHQWFSLITQLTSRSLYVLFCTRFYGFNQIGMQ